VPQKREEQQQSGDQAIHAFYPDRTPTVEHSIEHNINSRKQAHI
jgi:hypothetical protein